MSLVSRELIDGFRSELTKSSSSVAAKVVGRGLGSAVPYVTGGAKRLIDFVRSPAAARMAAGVAGGTGAGAVGGALIGGGAGAVGAYQDATARGAGLGESLAEGAFGGLRGAARRGAEGALLGGALGGGGALLSKKVPGALAKLPVVGGGARFGQRQLHGLTGWKPEAGLRSIRGGAYDAAGRLESAASDLRSATAAGKGVEKATAARDRAVRGFEASSKAEEMGLTSLPGYARALMRNPTAALKAGFGEQWHGQSGKARLANYGLVGAGLANEVRNRDPEEGMSESLGRAAGAAVPWLAGPLPTAAGLVLTPATALAGGLVGKGLDRMRRHAMPPGPTESDAGNAQVTERVYTDRATGSIEGI